VKEIYLLPEKSLPTKQYPLQKHWFVLLGECIIETVYNNAPQVIHIKQGHSYEIGPGVLHLAKNPSTNPCHILEVRYFQETKNEKTILHGPGAVQG
jgi:mannose-6-phosphate isomerase-like protein (cupin superfamily)